MQKNKLITLSEISPDLLLTIEEFKKRVFGPKIRQMADKILKDRKNAKRRLAYAAKKAA